MKKVLVLLVGVLLLSSCTNEDEFDCKCYEVTTETITYYVDGTNEFGEPITVPIIDRGQNPASVEVMCQDEIPLHYVYNNVGTEIGTSKTVCSK